MSARVEIYRDAYRGRPARLDLSTEKPHVLGHKGKWRWRFVSSNGRILADGSQGYSRRIDALNGCATVLGGVLVGTSGISTFETEIEPSTLVARLRLIRVHDLTREATS